MWLEVRAEGRLGEGKRDERAVNDSKPGTSGG